MSFTDDVVDQVWEKGKAVSGYNPNVYRQDSYGSWMRFTEYGKETEAGWEIDHIIPSIHGGGDELRNLQPLQWENNRRKGDNIR
jgi:5-methylcytosine-specific restriction endonuclease McrA